MTRNVKLSYFLYMRKGPGTWVQDMLNDCVPSLSFVCLQRAILAVSMKQTLGIILTWLETDNMTNMTFLEDGSIGDSKTDQWLSWIQVEVVDEKWVQRIFRVVKKYSAGYHNGEYMSLYICPKNA